LRIAEVARQDVTIENGRVTSYRVRLSISFNTTPATDSRYSSLELARVAWASVGVQQCTAMRTATLSTDHQLVARLKAPPDLSDGVESLGYWRERRRRLPWYRIGARREAARMTVRWEHRVRAALLTQPGASFALRLSAGMLVARTGLRRWARRAGLALTAAVAVAVVAAPAVAALALLVRLF
jgi:Dodecin